MLTTKKIVYIFLGFVAGFFVMVGLSLWARQPRWYFEERAQYYMQRATQGMILQSERVLAEDTYGGYTPEETFAMFLDALRAGDTDLASKFFVVQKQEEWRENLKKVRMAGFLSDMIDDLAKAEPDQVDGNLAWFSLPGKNSKGDVIYSRIAFSKNNNGLWKINQL